MIYINFIKVLDALTGAYSYNIEDEAMELLYLELIDRFNCKDCVWTEEGNIVYGTMVILFGEYGTSPRSGWFTDETIVRDCVRWLEDQVKALGGES